MASRAAVAIGCLFLVFVNASASLHAQDLPPCGYKRPTSLGVPWAGDNLWCPERVLENPAAGAVGYTALATAPDGSLYAVLPLRGEMVHITDTDGDALPDSAAVLLDGLPRPTGIAYHDDALYIAGNAHITRYDIGTGDSTLLVDDLPFGWTGYPTGNVTVHDGRLYVGAGGDIACTPGRGAVYSFALDGTDRRTIAQGITAPADIAYFAGALWVVDTATDRLLQLVPGTDYGACSGDAPPSVPALTFAEGSAPFALTPYTADTFPHISDTLLVALRGTGGNVIVTGYEVASVTFDERGVPVHEQPVVPLLPASRSSVSEQRMHIQASGFYPNHVYGVATDANGWVYISVGAGQVIALRPV
jgi:glucose/arabinose dehydrogenase